ncbi:unnamed protein product [Rhizoctonia solani]|uniref:Opioid growth factor receptor (OGFr) conserved domain-containing protein n=1 Tax=Rhizoctonia solani TaxID=456999 RepID=A0A8H2ZU34_9AGAM|nr:unnamed protein product [Rhizoctonia solani]
MSRLSIPNDVKQFLKGYPNNELIDADTHHLNLKFYSNETRFLPDGLLIEEFLDSWKGKYEELEYRHDFIQWLFPIPEQGNSHPLTTHEIKEITSSPDPALLVRVKRASHPLTTHEIKEITSSPDPALLVRVKRAYELMLDFYGMKLLDTKSGLIGRKDHGWEERYRHLQLVASAHNNLRITRILKCLSILSYPHYAAPFVLHVLNEQSEHGLLNTLVIQDSLDRWWANCNRNEQERETVGAIVARIRDRTNKWTFTRAMYEQMIHAREAENTLALPN